MKAKNVSYRWPDLSPVVRRYIVRDDAGRLGIAWGNTTESLTAHPLDVPPAISATPDMRLPDNAVVMTTTTWSLDADGTYRGVWYDYEQIGDIPPGNIRHIRIIEDLGYYVPDKWIDRLLAGSDEPGHWDYGATIAYIPPERDVKGQNADEMTIAAAVEYCREVGEPVSARGLRKAAIRGYIPGARKVGRDWLLTYKGVNHYLDNRPKRGPRPDGGKNDN